ncbi:MAG: hypothetical protein WC552_08825 [Candidatus Omnitrophota bacterium]
MKQAIFFIAYHPGALADYGYMAGLDAGKSAHILVICSHPYLTAEMISAYTDIFDEVVVLPDIQYEKNLIRGFGRYTRFMEQFRKKTGPLLSKIDTFSIISDCSAYLPVNALLSHLKNSRKCRSLVSTRQDHRFEADIDYPKTFLVALYTFFLRLYRVYYDKMLTYSYAREPRDRILRLLGPFENDGSGRQCAIDSVFIFNLRKDVRHRSTSGKPVVIFFSDRSVKIFGSDLTKEDYSFRLKNFLLLLSHHYHSCRLICRPHPLDKGEIIDEANEMALEVSRDNLMSQTYIDINAENIRACYSIASTSLQYAASIGIPSYPIYKYLGYNQAYPGQFFESSAFVPSPFLCHISRLDEIGSIDNKTVNALGGAGTGSWEEAVYGEPNKKDKENDKTNKC